METDTYNFKIETRMDDLDLVKKVRIIDPREYRFKINLWDMDLPLIQHFCDTYRRYEIFPHHQEKP